MSHELRTPLNGVLGMAQAMARGDLSPLQRDRLGIIETSGEALLSLLNDLLDLSKIEAGKIELEDGVIDIQALADNAEAIFTALIRDKDVAFRFSVAPDANGYWRGDPTRVRQVVYNLISNAVKFTERGSIAVDLTHTAAGLVIRVEDTGVGIAPDRLARVFDRFVQADASTTRRHGGSGLGLTICRDLVNLMGGDIRVESEEGVGTAFIARLPLTRTEDRPQAVQAEDDADLDRITGGVRILAAEDNAVNQLVLTTLLGEVGLETTIVSNGQEALDAWRDGLWDVVLMDVQMPVMDGVTAVRRIREIESREGRQRIPVVGLTANAMPHQQADYIAAGMDAVVAKPIELAVLLQTIEAALASRPKDLTSAA
jgi:CheY-like chemotaxis protein/anti-sigma regulatory factor (Ser/Thr protein kinase)